jgi:hypothetical protein
MAILDTGSFFHRCRLKKRKKRQSEDDFARRIKAVKWTNTRPKESPHYQPLIFSGGEGGIETRVVKNLKRIEKAWFPVS